MTHIIYRDTFNYISLVCILSNFITKQFQELEVAVYPAVLEFKCLFKARYVFVHNKQLQKKRHQDLVVSRLYYPSCASGSGLRRIRPF